MIARLLLPVLLLSTALPLAAPVAAATTAAPNVPQSAELKALFAASDEAQLKRNPIQALFRGDMRYAPLFGDFITDAYLAGEKAAGEADLASLRKIDRAKLNADDRISYDVFKYQTEIGLRGFEPGLLKASIERPIDHFGGFQVFIPTSRRARAPHRSRPSRTMRTTSAASTAISSTSTAPSAA